MLSLHRSPDVGTSWIARAMMTLAWAMLLAVRVERRANNIAQAKVIMARAIQEVPTSGLLWSETRSIEDGSSPDDGARFFF
jgi:hypothetical protein